MVKAKNKSNYCFEFNLFSKISTDSFRFISICLSGVGGCQIDLISATLLFIQNGEVKAI